MICVVPPIWIVEPERALERTVGPKPMPVPSAMAFALLGLLMIYSTIRNLILIFIRRECTDA